MAAGQEAVGPGRHCHPAAAENVPQFAARFLPAGNTDAMLAIHAHITIARPPAAVFALAGDYRNDPQWRGAVTAVTSADEPRLGARLVETIRYCGLRAESRTEILAFQPGRRLAFRTLSGPVPCEGRRLFEVSPYGTRFRYELRLAPAGAWRWLGPPLGLLLRCQLRSDLRRLRHLLEAQPALRLAPF